MLKKRSKRNINRDNFVFLLGNAEMTDLFKCPKKGQVCCASKSKIHEFHGMIHRNDTIPSYVPQPQPNYPQQNYPSPAYQPMPPNNYQYSPVLSQPSNQNVYQNYIQQPQVQPQIVMPQSVPQYQVPQQYPVAVPPNSIYPTVNNVIPPVYPTPGNLYFYFYNN